MPVRTALTEALEITHPILLAPMDVVADARLAAAVSAAGGFGILGGGYGNEEWLRRELDLLGGLRFGIGFITWSLARQPGLLDLALTHRPAAIMLSFGDPAPFAARVKAAGALLICQVQSIATARQAVAAGCDILVVQGTEAGGHGATRGLFSLIPEVADAVAREIPIVAAGGVADGRGLAAAIMLGAGGVLMGTRLYTTRESAASQAAKERVVAAGGDDTLRSKVFDISRGIAWPEPFTGRCLRNAHADRWSGREDELLRHQPLESEKYAKARQNGNLDIAAVIAGESCGLIRDIPSARDVVERCAREAEALLSRRERVSATAI